jgi:hypothetical protein
MESLVAERERLLDIQEQAKAAGPKLKRINELIALYGNDAEDGTVDALVSQATKRASPTARALPANLMPCPECGKPARKGAGMAAHLRMIHGKSLADDQITPAALQRRQEKGKAS